MLEPSTAELWALWRRRGGCQRARWPRGGTVEPPSGSLPPALQGVRDVRTFSFRGRARALRLDDRGGDPLPSVSMRISVIGCGYLGAVHAASMAELGHD